MEITNLIQKKISIKTEDYFRIVSFLKELNITLVSSFTTSNRHYLTLKAEESIINKLREEFEKETGHPLIII